jgi:hypothetical protein
MAGVALIILAVVVIFILLTYKSTTGTSVTSIANGTGGNSKPSSNSGNSGNSGKTSKPSTPAPIPAVVTTTTVTTPTTPAPTPTSTAYRTFEATNIPGFDIQVIPNVATIGDCQQRCEDNPRCNFLTHRKSDGTCWLKATKDDPTASTMWNGDQPFNPDNVVPGDIPYFDLQLLSMKTPEQCFDACKANSQCQWTNQRNGLCFLKRGTSDATVTSSGRFRRRT